MVSAPAFDRQAAQTPSKVVAIGEFDCRSEIVGRETQSQPTPSAMKPFFVGLRFEPGGGKTALNIRTVVQARPGSMCLERCLGQFDEHHGILTGGAERPSVREDRAIVVPLIAFAPCRNRRRDNFRKISPCQLMSRHALTKNASTATATRRAPRSSDSLLTTPRFAQISVRARRTRR